MHHMLAFGPAKPGTLATKAGVEGFVKVAVSFFMRMSRATLVEELQQRDKRGPLWKRCEPLHEVCVQLRKALVVLSTRDAECEVIGVLH